MRRLLKSRRRLLQHEPLEARRLLAITVDTLVDEADGSIVDGDISLRDALALAPSGETIDFDASLDGGTILLTLGELVITDALTIDATALADGLTIDASGHDPSPDENNGDGSRVFDIDDGDDRTDSPVAISGLTLTGGDALRDGGAISTRENLTVAFSAILGNEAGDGGGGIFAFGNVTVTSSTVSGNLAGYGGGGIYAVGNVTVTNSTISANSADRYGGGIKAFGDVTVISSTISGNSARNAGGIRANGDVMVSIENSIVAGNTSGMDAAPDLRPGTDILTVRYSLIGDNTRTRLAEAPVGTPDANGNLIGGPINGIIDPLLAPLADNGGPTQTHALLFNSPAKDAGDPAFTPPPDFDQRGSPFSRVFHGRIDMGAYERHTGDMDFDGDVDMDDIDVLVVALRDAGAYEDMYGAPPNSNGDIDGDGDLDFDDIPGFIDLLRPGASALRTANGSFDVIGVENDPVDAKLSTETRRETSNVSNLPRLKLLPTLKKRVSSSRLQSASVTKSRELRDDELATIWSGDFDWLHGVGRDRFG